MGTETKSRDAALRVTVRQRIQHGQLPVVRPTEITASYGSGRVCEVCDCPITPRQAEYEVEDSYTGRKLRFHSECHGAWQCECAQMLTDSECSRAGPGR